MRSAIPKQSSNFMISGRKKRKDEKLDTKKSCTEVRCSFRGAENEARTRDPNLGKVVLYQLSYFRSLLW